MSSSETRRAGPLLVSAVTSAPDSENFMTVSSTGIICPRRTEHPLNFITFPSVSPALQQKPRWLSPRLPVPKTSHSAKKLAKPGLAVATTSSMLNFPNNTSKSKSTPTNRPSSNSHSGTAIFPPKRRAQTTKEKTNAMHPNNKSPFPSGNSKRKSFLGGGQKQKDNSTGNKSKTEIIPRGRQELYYRDQSSTSFTKATQRQKESSAAGSSAHPHRLLGGEGLSNGPANGQPVPSTDFTLKAVLATSKRPGGELSERFQVIRSEEERERNPECLRLDRCALKHFPLIGNASTKDKEAANLRLVSLQHNLITRLENLPSLNHLVVLDLYDNRVERITGLQGLSSLRVLLLGKNRIRRIEGLDGLKRLEVLDLHGNQLRYVDNLGSLASLRVLNLAGNLLRNIRNLGPYGLSSLSELNLRRNRIRNLDGLQKAPHLKKLLLANNDLQSLSSLYSLRKLVFLQEVLLEPNPLCSVPDYRSQVLTVFPWLEVLDRCPVTDQMRLDAKIWHRKRIAEEEDKRKEQSRLRTLPGSREQIIYQARQRWESVKNFVKNSNSVSSKQPLSSPTATTTTITSMQLQGDDDDQCCKVRECPSRSSATQIKIYQQEEEAEKIREEQQFLLGVGESDQEEQDIEVEPFQYLYDQHEHVVVSAVAVDEHDGNEQQGACGNNSDPTSADHHRLPISFNTFLHSDTTATTSRLMIDDPPTGIRVNSNRNRDGNSLPSELHLSPTAPTTPGDISITSNANVGKSNNEENESVYTNINSTINPGGCGRSLHNHNQSSADQQQIDPLSPTISPQGKHNQHQSPALGFADKDKGTKIAVVRPLVRDLHFNEPDSEKSARVQPEEYLTSNSNELKLLDDDNGAGLTRNTKKGTTGMVELESVHLLAQSEQSVDVIRLLSADRPSGNASATVVGRKKEDETLLVPDSDQVVGNLTELQEVRKEKEREEINANVMATFERDTTGTTTHNFGSEIALLDAQVQSEGICLRRSDRLLRRSASTCLPTSDSPLAEVCGQEIPASFNPCPTSLNTNTKITATTDPTKADKLSSLRNLRSASFDVRFPSSDSDSSDETCSIATSNATSDLSSRRGLRKQLFPRSRPRLKLRGVVADRVNLRAQSGIATMGRRQGGNLLGASRNDTGKGIGKSGAVRRCDSAVVGESSPTVPMRKQGADYLVEIDGKILSIYGQGALKHTLMGFPASVTCNVTTAKFHYISYDSIIPYFGKLRQIYPSLEHFQFRANNLVTLAQLNALADLQGLTSLHIAKEGNTLIQHELWPHYATYRLSHWGLQNVNGKEVSSEYRGGTLSSQAKGFESLGYVALSCLPQTALTPLAKRLHMLHCFCCCSPSSSSDDSGKRKIGPNGSPTESSGNVCTSWDDDPVLLDVIGKEALVYSPPLQNKEDAVACNGGTDGRTETLSKIINSGCEILEKLDMLEEVWPSLMTEVIQEILMDYLFMDNYMKKELKKLQDTAMYSKKTHHH